MSPNPRGRPPKLAPEAKRDTASQITVRLNADERALLERLARDLRCSNGEVLRRGLVLLAEAHP